LATFPSLVRAKIVHHFGLRIDCERNSRIVGGAVKFVRSRADAELITPVGIGPCPADQLRATRRSRQLRGLNQSHSGVRLHFPVGWGRHSSQNRAATEAKFKAASGLVFG